MKPPADDSAAPERMVPLKALHDARAAVRKYRTKVEMLEAEKAGWLVERERLVGLISASTGCSVCGTSRRAGREP